MNKSIYGLFIFFVGVGLLFSFPIGSKPLNVTPQVISTNRSTSRIVEDIRALESEIEFYRELGDNETVTKLLDEIRKITKPELFISKFPESDCNLSLNNEIRQNSPKSSLDWGSDGHIGFSGDDEKKPFICRDPYSDTLYAVSEVWYDDTTSTFAIYKSYDGRTWDFFLSPSVSPGGRRISPTLTIDLNYIYVAYIYDYGDHEIVWVYRVNKSDTSDHLFTDVSPEGQWASPFIDSDYEYYSNDTWLYLAYADIDGDSIYFARSTNQDTSWYVQSVTHAPGCWSLSLDYTYVEGMGSHVTLVFEKFESMHYYIYYADGGDFGSAWSGFTNLTQSFSHNTIYPFHRNGNGYIVVTFMYYWDPDWDIYAAVSPDNGESWSTYSFAYTWFDDVWPTVDFGLGDTFYVAYILDDDTLTSPSIDTAIIVVSKYIKTESSPMFIESYEVNDENYRHLTCTNERPFVIAGEGSPVRDSSFVGVAWTRLYTSAGDYDTRWDSDFQPITQVEEQSSLSFTDLKVIPQPERLLIGFSLVRAADVEISLYDISGRLVTKRELGTLSAGYHSESIRLKRSGVYFVVLNAGGDIMLSKSIFVR